MRRHFSLVIGVVLLGSPVIAADPPGKVVLETWDAAYLNGGKSGFVHTAVRAVEKDNQKLFHAMTELDLSVKRFNDTARIYMQSGTVEDEDGKVTSVSMKQLIAKGQELVLTGNVEDGQLHVKVQGGPPMDKKIRWSPQVVGLYREQTLFKEKKAKPGDQFSYLHYEPLVNAVLGIKVEVKEFEDVSILGAAKQRLLRAEATPDPIMGVQLPATSLWLDKDLNVIRSLTQMEGMGQLELVRTTKAAALRKGQANTDLGLRHDLNVRAIRRPPSASNDTKVGEEFLKSNYYINSDDEKVRELASQAMGGEKDPWRKAQRIERWVRRNMNKEKQANYSEAMATADHVARTLEGDCTEYAMLAAAMCRAVGVPSRTAIGLVYAEVKATDYRPMLAFHMWTEVWVNGQWLGLDATLGQGSVGAEHLKITDHSWDGVQSVVPLLPVTRVILGKPQVEVLQIKKEDR